MRIVFLCTGDIGLPSLHHLIQSPEHELLALVTQPDKPVGRKQVLTPPAVKTAALAAGIPVYQPEKIRHFVADLEALQADVFVVVAYGQLLPKAILDLPKQGCLNIHASLLPRHRGAAPIQAAIRDGDPQSGVTIMWMDEGLDTGDILLQGPFALSADETGASLHERLAQQAPALLDEALQQIQDGTAPHVPQDPTLVTHVKKLDRSHGRLDWTKPAIELERLIRAFQPWPGTHALLPVAEEKSLQLKVFKAQLSAAPHPLHPGEGHVQEQRWWIGTGNPEQALELLEVQLEGKKRISVADFLRGQSAEALQRLL